MSARALIVLLSFVAFGATAQQNAEWRQPFPAFKLIGNVYWVGTYDLSTYLITTDAGHILINTGFVETVPEIKKGVEQLGFDFDDVEILTATHAHGDHVAGLAELKRLTGAQMLMSEADAVLLEDAGVSDFRFGDPRNPSFEPVASRSPCAKAAATTAWSSPTWAASIPA
jgi:metallo-beta-lactamase class B